VRDCINFKAQGKMKVGNPGKLPLWNIRNGSKKQAQVRIQNQESASLSARIEK
jgi:hypothetical protein